MHVVVYYAADFPEIGQRLQECGVPWQPASDTAAPALAHDSTGLVILVPSAKLDTEAWSGLQVRLARASRFFVVAGAGLTTAKVMAAARDGAYDVLDMKDPLDRWRQSIQRAVESQQLWVRLYAGAPLAQGDVMIGESPPMKSLRQTIDRLGPTDVTVLISGESGSGKEKVANALHQAGARGPFQALNCAAIPKDLLESEVFGVEKGAFTGALKSRPGLVEQADGGTLFLDEIGEMDLALQPKLLRFLETRTARRVGGEREYKVSVRMVSATNRHLEEQIQAGLFRADLFYRLSEVTLRVPPLRSHAEDIPAFVREFIGRANERFGKNIESAEPELIQKFQHYDWPGNVRELKSVIDRLVLLFDSPVLRAGFWDAPVRATAPPAPAHSERGRSWDERALPGAEAARIPSRRDRLELARRLLEEGRLSLTEVAAQVSVHPTTLFRWRQQGKF